MRIQLTIDVNANKEGTRAYRESIVEVVKALLSLSDTETIVASHIEDTAWHNINEEANN